MLSRAGSALIGVMDWCHFVECWVIAATAVDSNQSNSKFGLCSVIGTGSPTQPKPWVRDDSSSSKVDNGMSMIPKTNTPVSRYNGDEEYDG